MIEVSRTAAGEPVFTFDGKLLCSKFAPRKEARDFVQRHKNKIEPARTVFFLGLGGGHTVEAVRAAYPEKKIIVIEREEEILKIVSNYFGFAVSTIELKHLTSLTEIKADRQVAAALKNVYCVLPQSCTQWLHAEFYREAAELLLGRTADAFAHLLSVREDIRAALRPLVEMDGPVTVKTLAQNLTPENRKESAVARMLIKSLRELVI